MTVRIKNLTTSEIQIAGMEPYNVLPPGVGEYVEPPVYTAQKSIGYIMLMVSKTIVEFDEALLEDWERAILGLIPSGGTTSQPEEDSLIVYIQPPAVNAGQVDYEYWYALGAGPGDPATKITYSYTDALFPTKVTGIKIEHTTLP